MNAITNKLLGAMAALMLMSGVATMTTGCATGRADRVDSTDPMLSLQATRSEIYAGETMTVTTHTENLLGRDSEVKWTTTGGELTTEDNGRIARVTFDRAGKYVISAQLFIDGELTETDTVTVNVLPLR